MIYGSLSALGFATLENAHYFGRLGLGIVFWRFLLSTVLHMALTSIPCYAWAYAAHVRRRGSALLPVLGGLAAAALLHGAQIDDQEQPGRFALLREGTITHGCVRTASHATMPAFSPTVRRAAWLPWVRSVPAEASCIAHRR